LSDLGGYVNRVHTFEIFIMEKIVSDSLNWEKIKIILIFPLFQVNFVLLFLHRLPPHIKMLQRFDSWVNHLQREAQASEMDGTNTPPEVFLLLVCLQTLVVLFIADVFGETFQLLAILGVGGHWLGWLLSVLIGSNNHFDFLEDVLMAMMIIFSFVRDTGGWELSSFRQKVMLGAALIWISRLCIFVVWRVLHRGSDFRFTSLCRGHCFSLFGWTAGGVWCFMNGFAIWRAFSPESAASSASVDLLDLVGFAIFLVGLFIETAADLQKSHFNQHVSSGQQHIWVDTGLWSISRHPNYFGENLVWLGMGLLSVGGIAGISVSSVALAAVSPLWSLFFLVFTSLMLLEKRADTKWGRKLAYEEYKKKTNVLGVW
jgi:steroid 5-alpha reductase family enzyme